MKINAVTISVNCSDVLAWTLPSTRVVFDQMVVVTSKNDEETKKICKYWNVQCVETDLFYKDGAKFNKGLGIQLGLEYLNSSDWVCNIDADIFLPPQFNDYIRCKKYNKDCLYGIDRLDVKGWDTWINFYINPFSMFNVGSTWAGFPVMYRVTQGFSYHAIGYFQMWHSQCRYAKDGYPINSSNAADSDLKFSANYPAENRILIPEVFVYHLSSETGEAKIGTDWEGRKSPKFGPKGGNP